MDWNGKNIDELYNKVNDEFMAEFKRQSGWFKYTATIRLEHFYNKFSEYDKAEVKHCCECLYNGAQQLDSIRFLFGFKQIVCEPSNAFDE